MAKTKRERAIEAKRLYKVKKRFKYKMEELKALKEKEEYKKFMSNIPGLEELKREYRNKRKDVQNRTKMLLNELDLNIFLFWWQVKEEKTKNWFEFFSDLWMLDKTEAIDFWWVKISKTYFDKMMK